MGNPGGALIEPLRGGTARRIITGGNDMVGRRGEGGNRGSQLVSSIREKAAFCVKPSGLACEQFVERCDEGRGLLVTDLVIQGIQIPKPPL